MDKLIYMNRILIILSALAVQFFLRTDLAAQLTCSNDIFADTTSYTNGEPNDSIFFICSGQTATLVVSPEAGTGNWDFVWQQFSAAGNAWNALVVQSNLATGTQNVGPGGYRVTVFDATDTEVGTYVAWVCRINTNPSVNVNPIAAGCGNVQLTGSITNGSVTPYYNTPVAFDPNQALVVDATTEITICFTAEHSYISDLAFYVVGPASCGSPTLLLAPSPGVCNGCCMNGDSDPDINNLCFSTEVTNTLNMCSFSPNEATGTYGAYGAGATPINWSALYGCEASQAGWSVQIYDCVGADTGSLTDGSLTFSGTSVGNDPVSYAYTTPANFSSGIADNSCTAATASIFTVPAPPAVPINFTFGYEWVADPPFIIPGSSSSLNITLNPGPTEDTNFTLSLIGNNPGAVCGGTSSDTELYDYTTPAASNIIPLGNALCEQLDPVQLSADFPTGTWSGTGIISASAGTFDPDVAGAGTWTVTFTPTGNCISPSSTEITVIAQPAAVLSAEPVLCSSADPIVIETDIPGGSFTGDGIVDGSTGIFDPALLSDTTVTVTYFIDGLCPVNGTVDITVVQQEALNLSATQNPLCAYGESIQLSSNLAGGIWSGDGIVDPAQGTFDPLASGVGSWVVNYMYNDVCYDEASLEIQVVDTVLVIEPLPALCITSDPIAIETNSPGGVWIGPGISDPSGVFDAEVVGVIGFYTVYYNSGNVCNEFDSLVIEVIGTPEVNITLPSMLCEEAASLQLLADVPGGFWSGDGIVDAESGLFDPAAAGAGQANITYSIPGICEVFDSGSIQVNPTPNVNAGADLTICEGVPSGLNASGASVYSWSPAAGLSNSNIANPQANPAITTTYTVTGVSQQGCAGFDQITVGVNDAPVVSVNGPLTICRGEEIQIIANGLEIYNWSGSNLSSYTVNDPLASPIATTTYQLTGFDDNGCEGSASVVVNVIDPVAYFTSSVMEGMAPLDVTFYNDSEGDSFEWDFANGNQLETTDGNFDPTATYNTEGVYTVTITSTLDGCEESYSLDILVFYNADISLIPNIVSFNGDNKNDTFRILSNNIREMNVNIFDRWGKLVGTIDRPTGEWSPRDEGAGTYYYVLSAVGFDGKKFDSAGYFTAVE
jgi:gliding motility-associated-like protein